MRQVAAFVVVWFSVMLASGGSAAEPRRDRETIVDAFRRATKLYDLGEYAKALASFKALYDYADDPAILYNIAQCHRKLGRNREAIEVYQSYLRKAPNASNQSEVRAMIARLQKTLPPGEPAVAAPPLVVTPTPTPTPTTPPTLTATPPDKPPLHKRWVLWVPVSLGVVAIGLGVGLGVGLSRSSAPTGDFPTRGVF